MNPAQELAEKGWVKFSFDPQILAWVNSVHEAANQAIDAPENAVWRRAGGTWFVGVNVLPNDPNGCVPGGVPLAGQVIDFLPRSNWDRAQISVMYPGYPIQDKGETDASFRFRQKRFAAHVDGLTIEGTENRRFLTEPHAFVLGLPLTDCAASPLMAWEGSHKKIKETFANVFADIPPDEWSKIDVTDAYKSVRKTILNAVEPTPVIAKPGEAYVIHRLALHGVAPWTGTETTPRKIAYFRPTVSGSIAQWLALP